MLVQNLLNHYLNITKYPCNVTIGSFSFLNIIKMLQWIILCFNFSSSSVFPDFQKWNYCFGRRKKLFLSTQFMLCINKHSIFYLFVNTHFQYQRMKKTSNIHLLIFKICLSPISTKTSYFILLYSRSSNDWKHSVFLRYTMKKKLGGASICCHRWRWKDKNMTTLYTDEPSIYHKRWIKLTCTQHYCCMFPFDLVLISC